MPEKKPNQSSAEQVPKTDVEQEQNAEHHQYNYLATEIIDRYYTGEELSKDDKNYLADTIALDIQAIGREEAGDTEAMKQRMKNLIRSLRDTAESKETVDEAGKDKATDPTPELGVESFKSLETVQYNDGAVNLLFAEQGDIIAWNSGFKYAYDPRYGQDRTIVRTKSGNRYILGDGLVVNVDKKTAYDLSQNLEKTPDIVIGESWTIPGFMQHTSDIENVEIEYKMAPKGWNVSRQINEPNPFAAAKEYLEAAREHFDAAGN